MPAGKRLVIEFVSVSMTVDSHLRPSAGIATTSGGTSNQHSLGLQPVNTSEGVTSYVASQSLRLFADPGAEVRMSGGFSPTDATWDDRVFLVSLSGYLVDVP